jgi:hypothetical protein
MNHRVSGASSIRKLCGALFVGAIWQFGACGDSDDTPTPVGNPSSAGDAGSAGSGSSGGSGGATQPPPSSPDSGVVPTPEDPDAGPTTFCTPGETQPCQFEFLCSGLATCSPDGSAFGVCDCGALSSDVVGIVGARCESDADCADGAFCMSASSDDFVGPGGPAGGYCTFSCMGDTDCTVHDPISICSPVAADGSSVCIRLCQSKDPAPGEAKCLNRSDVVCASVVTQGIEQFTADRQLGFCAPRCGSDDDCPQGRVCHRQGGICTDMPAPGAPVGSACNIDDDCDGRACEDRVNGVGVCTASCVLGSLAGCGFGREVSSRDAACVVPVVAAGGFSEGAGDMGFCLELCDVDADCQQAGAGFVCRALTEDFATFFGRPGACARGAAAQ